MSNEITVQDQEIKTLVKKLKDKSIGFYAVPEEYRYHPLIVIAERELGMRRSIRKGYDIIRNNFFVDERIGGSDSVMDDVRPISFADFSAYYDFLQGDIYDNACYYGYCFSQESIDKYSIDLGKLNFKALIANTIDDFTLDFSKEERAQYRAKETRKKAIVKALNKLNACTTYEEFQKQINFVSRFENIPLEFFLSNFIFHDKEKAFNIVMEYLNHTYSFGFEETMCLIYEPQAVLAAYKNTYYAQTTAKKYAARLKQFVAALEKDNIELWDRAYFDEQTHFFLFYTIAGYESNSKIIKVATLHRYFETLEELMEFRGNDLSYCDLSKAIIPNLDLSKYKIGNRTNLPIQYQSNVTCSLEKLYDRANDKFVVNQNWTDEQGVSMKSYHHTFKHFFDFVYFLKGDLSDADLLFCEGLVNVRDFSELNLNNARLQSRILDKLGVKYEVAFNSLVETVPVIQQNEEDTIGALMLERETCSFEESLKCQKIYYVSDLHLLHRLNNAGCKSANDVVCTIQKVIDDLLSKVQRWERNIILIGGDTSSDFAIFNQFISMLRKTLDDERLDVNIIFTLGNHELWDFPQRPLEEIVAEYKKVLSDNGMFLLQNNILFKDDCDNIGEISTDEIQSLSSKELKARLNEARIILFGGLAFAGYNEKFNANLLIYRYAMNRQQEIEETKKFEVLYRKICADLSDKRVIVFTHMPQKDWCADTNPQSGFAYVNGHTHRNYFYDDGDYRVYADNQIGYKHVHTYLKHFYIDDDYDIFIDYEDGIHEISREQYIRFYSGKNIGITFNREFHKLFMLKKNGYYTFILQYPSGKLTILNGGALKSLEHKDINYYFEKMDDVVSYIKSPLDKFTEYQKQISAGIKAIGGSGTIHGSIVDIDFLNHIYVNPLDFSITPYFASDVVWKVPFPDTPKLLQANRPDLYKNYLKQIEGHSSAVMALQEYKTEIISVPQPYLDTDIYRASREIKKMQKLSSNILSVWIEPTTKKLSDKNE